MACHALCHGRGRAPAIRKGRGVCIHGAAWRKIAHTTGRNRPLPSPGLPCASSHPAIRGRSASPRTAPPGAKSTPAARAGDLRPPAAGATPPASYLGTGVNVGGRLSASKKAQALAAKEAEFRALILRAYKAQALEGETFFHGKTGGRLVVVGPINLPVGRLFVEEVITECRKRGASRADVLAFEFEMGLFPAALEEARGKGIDLAPKTIPPEVFDKRAVDKGQVQFFDIAYVEAQPQYAKGRTAKDRLTLAIALTDFSVHYTQGAAEAAEAALKDGKSAVVCHAGQLY